MSFLTENSTLIIVALIVIGVLLVGWLVYRSFKRKDQVKPPTVSPKIDSEGEVEEIILSSDPEDISVRGPPANEHEAIDVSEFPDSPDEIDEVELEQPESVPSRLQRLRSRLANSGSIGNALLSVLSRGDLGEGDWEEIEDTLLMADVGLAATEQLMEKLRTEVKVRGKVSANEAKDILAEELLTLVQPDADRSLNVDAGEHPANILVVGVNGTGKTTTVGKISRLLCAEDKTVLLGAADTFRAAAAEQLSTWGERVGVEVVRSDREGADPASVAFETVKTGRENNVDVVIVDTAGRLQTKTALMDELGKVKRVMEKDQPVSEVLLVLDATTGQNGLRQAQVFAEVVGITGIVLTKLDGSAKGGIVISVQQELGVPVKLVGLGEGPDDLAPFDPEGFVKAILGE